MAGGRPEGLFNSKVWRLSETEQEEMNVVQLKEPQRCRQCRTENTLFSPRETPEVCYACYIRRISER
jgi:hypothetical protein